MQFTINSFRQHFPDKIFSLTIPWFSVKSLTFPRQLSNSLTFPGFPDKWSPCLAIDWRLIWWSLWRLARALFGGVSPANHLGTLLTTKSTITDKTYYLPSSSLSLMCVIQHLIRAIYLQDNISNLNPISAIFKICWKINLFNFIFLLFHVFILQPFKHMKPI